MQIIPVNTNIFRLTSVYCHFSDEIVFSYFLEENGE